MRNFLVPQSTQIACVAGLPFFIGHADHIPRIGLCLALDTVDLYLSGHLWFCLLMSFAFALGPIPCDTPMSASASMTLQSIFSYF